MTTWPHKETVYISRRKEAGNFNIFYIGEKLTIKHENKELKKKSKKYNVKR